MKPLLLPFFFGLAGAFSTAGAATLVVAPAGAPYAKIQDAVNAAKAGDTIVVKDGTYNENVTLKSNISLRSARKWGARVVSVQPWGDVFTFKSASGDSEQWPAAVLAHVTIDGFDVSGGSAPISIDWGHHLTVRNCRLSGGKQSGVGLGMCDYFTVEDNVVASNGRDSPWGSAGINVFKPRPWDKAPGYHNIIQRNACYNNGFDTATNKRTPEANGIIYDTARTSPRTLIANNLIYNNGGFGISLVGAQNVDVWNNTCYLNGWDTRQGRGEILLDNVDWEYHEVNGKRVPRVFEGVDDNGPCDHVSIRGNILWARAGQPAIASDSMTPTNVLDNNLLFNSIAPGGQTFEGTNALHGNPGFVFAPPAISGTKTDANSFANIANPGAGDFALSAGSPAIGAQKTPLLPDDYKRTARPRARPTELGALRFGR